MIFVFLWLTSLSKIISSSTHVAANSIISFFLWMSNIPLHIYIIISSLFIHLSMDIEVSSVSWILYIVLLWTLGNVYLSKLEFSSFLDICPGVRLLDYNPIFSFFFFFPIFLILKFMFNWRIIALQYCVGFCHASAWINCRYTYIPSLLNLPPTFLPIPPS